MSNTWKRAGTVEGRLRRDSAWHETGAWLAVDGAGGYACASRLDP
jgi:hypothetical protein